MSSRDPEFAAHGVEFGLASSEEDLDQILALQRANLEQALTSHEAESQGFVTLRHDLELLRDMQAVTPHVLARQAEQVVGYALATPATFVDRLPLLEPMIAALEVLQHRGRPVSECRYLIMGQVCVAREQRGRGVFGGLYAELRRRYAQQFELLVTEAASRNTRSVRAHERVGFELLRRYPDASGESWDLIVWDWS